MDFNGLDGLLSHLNGTSIAFGDYVFDSKKVELIRDGKAIKIEPQLLTFLLLLIIKKTQKSDQIVNKDLMIKSVWKGKSTSDDAVRAVVKKLRENLGDNARNPIYIKTIPTQGYLLLPDVEYKSPKGILSLNYTHVLPFSLVALVSIFMVIFFFQTDPSRNTIDNSTRENVIKLRSNDKVYVSAHIHDKNGILFSEKAEVDNSHHLYIDYDQDTPLMMLLGNEGESWFGRWSADGKKILAVNQNAKNMSVYILNFPEIDINYRIALDDMKGDDLLWVDWLNEKYKLVALKRGLNGNVYLSSLDVETTKATQLALLPESTYDNASVSWDGRYFAYSYLSGSNVPYLHLIDLMTDRSDERIRLPFIPTSIVWSNESHRLSLSSSNSELVSYVIASDRFINWALDEIRIHEVLKDCGDNCFIYSSRSPDDYDIRELILEKSKEANFIPVKHMSSKDKEKFPMYTDSGDLFYLKQNKDTKHLMIAEPFSSKQPIFDLPVSENINSLMINESGTHIVGEIGSRIFLYDLQMRTLNFVTNINQVASKPHWIKGEQGFSFNLETSFNDQPASSTMYFYSIGSSSSIRLGENLSQIFPIEDNEYLIISDNFVFSKVEGSSIIDAVANNTSGNSIKLNLNETTALNARKFKTVGNDLFWLFTDDDAIQISRFNLTNNLLTVFDISYLESVEDFDVDPSGNKVAVVKKMSSPSTLFKVENLNAL